MNPSETKLAYLAGVIDGEGSLGAYEQPHPLRPTSLGLVLTVAVADEVFIRHVESIYRGLGIQTPPRFYRIPRMKQGGVWRLSLHRRKQIKLVLSCVLPYLVLKRPQALRLLAICESAVSTRYIHTSNLEQLRLAAEIRQLNQRAMPIQTADAARLPVGVEIRTPRESEGMIRPAHSHEQAAMSPKPALSPS